MTDHLEKLCCESSNGSMKSTLCIDVCVTHHDILENIDPQFKFGKYTNIEDVRAYLKGQPFNELENLKFSNAVSPINKHCIHKRECDIYQLFCCPLNCFNFIEGVMVFNDVICLDHIDSIMSIKPTINFYDEFERVLHYQQLRRKCPNMKVSEIIDVPKMFRGITLDEAAKAVHNEYPTLWATEMMKHFLEHEQLVLDSRIIDQKTSANFVNSTILCSNILSFCISKVAKYNFYLKWREMVPRPEEICASVLNKDISVLTLQDTSKLRGELIKLGIHNQQDFTAYPEGSPNHPSWPAMHAAVSTISLCLSVICDLTDRQKRELRKLDYCIAFFRSIAGVHYESDNIAGLQIGQNIVSACLPDFIMQNYISEITEPLQQHDNIVRKIKDEWFDWRDYRPTRFAKSKHCEKYYSPIRIFKNNC